MTQRIISKDYVTHRLRAWECQHCDTLVFRVNRPIACDVCRLNHLTEVFPEEVLND